MIVVFWFFLKGRVGSKRASSIPLLYIPNQAHSSVSCSLSFVTPYALPRVRQTLQSYFKKEKLNISDSEVLSTIPRTLVWLALERKILPERPPEQSFYL